MVIFKKFSDDSLLSKNHCKVRSKPDVSLLSASREKPAPPLTHTSCFIVSMCALTSRFHICGSVFFVVVSGGGNFQDRPILPEVRDFSDLSLGSLVKFVPCIKLKTPRFRLGAHLFTRRAKSRFRSRCTIYYFSRREL